MCSLVSDGYRSGTFLLFQAGIASHDLILALEPEAASIYCQNIPVDMTVDAIGLASLMTGDQYLVADLGGSRQLSYSQYSNSLCTNRGDGCVFTLIFMHVAR